MGDLKSQLKICTTFEGQASSEKALALAQRGERKGDERRMRGKHQLCRNKKWFNKVKICTNFVATLSPYLQFCQTLQASLFPVSGSSVLVAWSAQPGLTPASSYPNWCLFVSQDGENLLLHAQLVCSRHGIPHLWPHLHLPRQGILWNVYW